MLYLSLDGGGTKTEGLLVNEQGTVLARGLAGPSNPNDLTLPVAADTLAALVRTLLADAAIIDAVATGDVTVSLFAGVAGALNHKTVLRAALVDRLSNLAGIIRIGIGSDVELLLAAEIPDGDGACIIVGTGSACFVRKGESIIRIGGWGYLLDSGGSGYDIGRDALEAALRAHDGRGEATTLSRRLADHLGCAVPDALTAIYAGGKTFIAACAPCVFAAAREDHDPIADAILHRNARSLAELVEAAYRCLYPTDCSASLSIIFGGSIAKHCPDYLALVTSLADPSLPLAIQIAKQAPVMGGIQLARRGGDA